MPQTREGIFTKKKSLAKYSLGKICIFTLHIICNKFNIYWQGDVWAESSVLGFLWHYYACMEGKIYDITEWASCQVTTRIYLLMIVIDLKLQYKCTFHVLGLQFLNVVFPFEFQNTHFKHIQANAHQVIYRIATSANRKHNTQRNK